VLRKIFGPNGDEVAGYRRRVHNEKLLGMYSSPNIFLVINLKRVGWQGHEARMGERTGTYWGLVEKPEGKREPGKLGLDGRILLQFIFKNCYRSVDWVDLLTIATRDTRQAAMEAVMKICFP